MTVIPSAVGPEDQTSDEIVGAVAAGVGDVRDGVGALALDKGAVVVEGGQPLDGHLCWCLVGNRGHTCRCG